MGVFGGKSSSRGGGDKKKKIPNSRKKKHRKMEGAMDFNETFANNPNNNANNGEITPLAQDEELIITETTSSFIRRNFPHHPNEVTSLDGGTGDVKKNVMNVNIEYLRMFGLSMTIVLSISGWIVSVLFDIYPVTDDPTNSAWDILANGAPSNFHADETYISYLFNFVHTCVYVDNNPAKTVTALLLQFAVIPLLLFAFLSYKRINLQTGPDYDGLKAWSPFTLAYLYIAFAYLFLYLVNTPMQDQELFDSPRATLLFTAHYIPFALYQLATIVMSLQQISFLYARKAMPFEWMTLGMVRAYFYVTVVMYIVYCVWIISHIFRNGIWSTTTPMGQMATHFMMYGFIVMSVIIPIICSFQDSKRSIATMRIEFSSME